MDEINNSYLKSLTLRVKDNIKSETVYNYPYSTVEELLTNAIVHKNYENPRSVQIYIYDDSIVITNYNKPIPPITIKDLNTKDSFPNRLYENPSIREMFKSLDLIESFGSGVGKAKRAMAENGSDNIRYQEYDENVDITSVSIPISKKYLEYSYKAMKQISKDQNLDFGQRDSAIKDQNLDFGHQDSAAKDQNLDFGQRDSAAKDQNLDFGQRDSAIKDQNLDFDHWDSAAKDQNLDFGHRDSAVKDQNLDFGHRHAASKNQNLDFDAEKIKINNVDTLGIITRSLYSNSIKKILVAIFDRFFNDEFSRADIVSYLNASKSASTNYISYLQKLNVVEQVKGKGKGKYRFR